jgi:hypothetical protein
MNKLFVFLLVSAMGVIAAVPDPPRGVETEVVTPTSVKLTWMAPVNNGGFPITKYKVVIAEDSGMKENAHELCNEDVTRVLASGLVEGRKYYFEIRACNKSNMFYLNLFKMCSWLFLPLFSLPIFHSLNIILIFSHRQFGRLERPAHDKRDTEHDCSCARCCAWRTAARQDTESTAVVHSGCRQPHHHCDQVAGTMKKYIVFARIFLISCVCDIKHLRVRVCMRVSVRVREYGMMISFPRKFHGHRALLTTLLSFTLFLYTYVAK